MKETDYYMGRDLKKPSKEEFTKWYIYNEGKLVWKGDHTMKMDFMALMRDNPSYVHQKVIDVEEFTKARSKYNAESGSRMEEFRQDLIASADLDPGNPKVEKLYDLAWEYGHGTGFIEVQHYFEDMLPLIL